MGGVLEATAGRAKARAAYLARYAHRIAISNDRIIRVTDREAMFRYRPHGGAAQDKKVMRLSHAAFLQRFLLHVLP